MAAYGYVRAAIANGGIVRKQTGSRTIKAFEFKARCLKLMDEIAIVYTFTGAQGFPRRVPR